jgi:hypothetical protein
MAIDRNDEQRPSRTRDCSRAILSSPKIRFVAINPDFQSHVQFVSARSNTRLSASKGRRAETKMPKATAGGLQAPTYVGV